MKEEHSTIIGGAGKAGTHTNHLFPIFLKLEQLRLLIVGGGYIGLEKLNAVLQNAPHTAIRLVGITISDEIKALASKHQNISLFEKAFHATDANDIDLAIVGINDPESSEAIAGEIKSSGKMVNVAGKHIHSDY